MDIIEYATIKKARKDHQCHGCLGQINAGEQYEVTRGTDGGMWWDWNLCQKCLDALKNEAVRLMYWDWTCDDGLYEGVMNDIMNEMEKVYDHGD